MTRRPHLQGLTLIELLVAIALGLIVFLVAANLLESSSRSATDLQGRSELLEESQIAQNYMAAQLREAVYVFPAGTTFDLGGGETVKRPGGGAWKVGEVDKPSIAAFVRPPQLLPAANCSGDVRYCYQFFAYYPMLRSSWVAQAGPQNNPGADLGNANRWVLVELRRKYASAPLLSSLQVNGYTPPYTNGEYGRLLLDYVQSQPLALPDTPPLFEVKTDTPQAPGNTSVTINLALSRQTRGRAITVPGRDAATTGPQSVTPLVVTPRNVGNLAP
ncbi:PilW family protein [Deinococcus frigens]|uniref:PilW family protein n=1 Tax=Deinococcus frigens TaxID=249403 RepID=UPI000496D84C|nr:prepilin-type N-terminal cleavage/methylation domain-containing protein [Deinococcus frigens]